MPVTMLYVEGKLDSVLLGVVLAGNPPIDSAYHSKDDLPHVIRRCRRKPRDFSCFIRDRDFDYEPPSSPHKPEVNKWDGDQLLGWHWCRTEIENYMLDPAIIRQIAGFEDIKLYESALVEAANSIRYYQAARWAVNQRRSALKAVGYLRNRPQECKEKDFCLINDLSESHCLNWARSHIEKYRTDYTDALDVDQLESGFNTYKNRFDDIFLASISDVLVWFSGKDLFKALGPWLASKEGPKGYGSPGVLRDKIDKWMREHPTEVLEALPEWREFREMLRKLDKQPETLPY